MMILPTLLHGAGVASVRRYALIACVLLSGSLVSAGIARAQTNCNCPYREYTKTPTPEATRLFAAAQAADTSAFLAALAAVPDPDAYAIVDRPLLLVILAPTPGGDNVRITQEMPRGVLDSIRLAHRATWPARERMLAAALARHVDPNAYTAQNGRPPLLAAAVFGSVRSVAILLAGGANPNVEDFLRDEQNAVEFALDHEFPFRFGYPEFVTPAERTAILRQLFRAGTKGPWGGARFRTPARSPWALLAALTLGDSVANDAIAAGLPPTQLDFYGIPALTAAAQFDNVDVVRVLKDRGPRSMSVHGDSVVFLTTPARDTSETDIWLDAVITAAADTTLRIADLLLMTGMPWTQPGPTGTVSSVPRHHMGFYGRDDAQNRESGATTTPPALAGGRNGDPIVHAAAVADNVPLLNRLLALGAPIDDTTQYGQSALQLAVRAKSVHAVRWLVEHGARVTRSTWGTSAISAALDDVATSTTSDGGDSVTALATAALLLHALRPADLRDSATADAVVSAILRNAPQFITTLDTLLQQGWQPPRLPAYLLVGAINANESRSIAWLLARNVALEAAPRSVLDGDESPLLAAMRMRNDSVVLALLARGADARTPDRKQMSPYLMAIVRGDTINERRMRGSRASEVMAPRPLRFAAAVTSGRLAAIEAVLAEGTAPLSPLPEWFEPEALVTLDKVLDRSLSHGLPANAVVKAEDNSQVSLLMALLTSGAVGLADKNTRRLPSSIDSMLAKRITSLIRAGATIPPVASRGRDLRRGRPTSTQIANELTPLAFALYFDAPQTLLTLFDAGARPTAYGLPRLWAATQCGGPRYAPLRLSLVRAQLPRPAPISRSACERLLRER